MVDVEKTKVARDWKKIVDESKGSMVFVPDSLIDSVKKWNEARMQLEIDLKKLSKSSTLVTKMLDEVGFKAKEYFESAGQDDIWNKELQIQTEALKEGVFILEVNDAR